MERIQYIRYALINDKGVIWEGLTRPTRSALFKSYTSPTGKGYTASRADGWIAKKVTLYFVL